MKRVITLVLYNIIAVIIILLLLEFFVRILHPEIKSQGTDKELIKENAYKDSPGFKPNSKGISNGVEITIDEYGLRQTKIPIDKTKVSWLLIGDSVTMGLGVESDSTFAFGLQEQNKNVNILNSGYFGYSLKDYINVIDYYLKKKKDFQIQKIALCWCLNDIYSGEVMEYESPGGGIRYFFNDILTWLRWNSRLYTFIKSYVSDRQKKYFEFDKQFYSPDSSLFVNAINQLAELNRKCLINKVEFMVVLLPYEYQLRERDNYQPQELMKKYLEEKNIRVVATHTFMVGESIHSKSLFLFGDGLHFSSIGHRWISEILTAEFNYE